MNKRLVFAVGAAALLALALGLALTDSGLSAYALKFLEVVQLLGLMEMLLNGTFISTRYFKVALALLGAFFIGALMTMADSPVADLIMLVSFVGILVTYIIHFSGKKPKTVLDMMKLSTLLFLFPLPLWFFRPISAETKHVALLVGHLVFAITFVLYIIVGERRRVW